MCGAWKRRARARVEADFVGEKAGPRALFVTIVVTYSKLGAHDRTSSSHMHGNGNTHRRRKSRLQGAKMDTKLSQMEMESHYAPVKMQLFSAMAVMPTKKPAQIVYRYFGRPRPV